MLDSGAFDGGRYLFLFGLCVPYNIGGFLDRFRLALYQLCQCFKKSVELCICHSWFHYLTSSLKGFVPLTLRVYYSTLRNVCLFAYCTMFYLNIWLFRTLHNVLICVIMLLWKWGLLKPLPRKPIK